MISENLTWCKHSQVYSKQFQETTYCPQCTLLSQINKAYLAIIIKCLPNYLIIFSLLITSQLIYFVICPVLEYHAFGNKIFESQLYLATTGN